MYHAFLHPVFPWEGQSPIAGLLWILIPIVLLVLVIALLISRSKKR